MEVSTRTSPVADCPKATSDRLFRQLHSLGCDPGTNPRPDPLCPANRMNGWDDWMSSGFSRLTGLNIFFVGDDGLVTSELPMHST